MKSAALGTMLPYGNFTNTRRVMSAREAMPTDPKAPDPGAGALFTAITPDYFDAIGVRILQGRDFTQAECENKEGPRVAIMTTRWRRSCSRTRRRWASHPLHPAAQGRFA